MVIVVECAQLVQIFPGGDVAESERHPDHPLLVSGQAAVLASEQFRRPTLNSCVEMVAVDVLRSNCRCSAVYPGSMVLISSFHFLSAGPAAEIER